MSKLTKSRCVELIGLHNKNGIVDISDVICFRKPLDEASTLQTMRRYKHAVGMVSCHNIYRKPNAKYVDIWCNCFREAEHFFPGHKNIILLSESDFVDPQSTIVYPRQPKDQFYYFTLGGGRGSPVKGLDLFIESLPVLCGEHNLRGYVINYIKSPLQLDKKQRGIWAKYKHQLVFLRKQTASNVAKIMSESKFGFFPNKEDCSPMLITESLVRDCPVLINESILGGWKYAWPECGYLFNADNLSRKIALIMGQDFLHVKDRFMEDYGFDKSSSILAKAGQDSIFTDFVRVSFAGYRNIMKKITSGS